jgi:hypothetical protein
MMLVRVRWGSGTHAAALALPLFVGAALFACGSGSPNSLLSGGAGGWGGGDPGTPPTSGGPPPSGTSGGGGAAATSSGTGSGSGSSGGSSGSTSSGTSGGSGTSSSTGASSGVASSGATGSSGVGGSSSGGLGSGSGSAAPDASVADSQAGDGALDGQPFTFSLIDTSIVATNGSPITGFDPIANGTTIDLASVGSTLSIRANVTDSNIADVQFDLDGRFHHTENGTPYMLCSNNGPTINNCNLGTGAHLLQATVFLQSRQGTTTGPTATIAFMIIDSSADAAAD